MATFAASGGVDPPGGGETRGRLQQPRKSGRIKVNQRHGTDVEASQPFGQIRPFFGVPRSYARFLYKL